MIKISKLQYITQAQIASEIIDEVKEALDAGVDWIQLRIKNEEISFLTVAEQVKKLCENRATFIINDHVEHVAKLDADGVHLGLTDMPVLEARKKLGIKKIIGGTANTLEDCINRQSSGVDYIGLGPFRFTATKEKLSPVLGLSGYQEILGKLDDRIQIPVVAIGGIEIADIAPLMKETRVHGIAVSGLIAKAENKAAVVAKIQKELA